MVIMALSALFKEDHQEFYNNYAPQLTDLKTFLSTNKFSEEKKRDLLQSFGILFPLSLRRLPL